MALLSELPCMKTKEATDPTAVYREQLLDLGVLLRSARIERGAIPRRNLAAKS